MAGFPRVHGWLEQLLHTHDTPVRTARAYALGVFFGFSPVLGLHTVLGLAFAFALNLNRVAVLLGVYSNLPWIIVPYYTLMTWMGAAILGIDIPSGTIERLVASLENRSWAEFRDALMHLRSLLWAFALGSTLGSGVLSLVAYRAALALISSHRQRVRRLQDPEM